MKKNILIIAAAVLLFIIGLSGCIDEKSKFIGTWESEGGGTTLEYNDDNTVAISGDGPLDIVKLTGNFDYSVGDNSVTFSSGNFGVTLDYRFPANNEMVLSDNQGNSMTFIKQ